LFKAIANEGCVVEETGGAEKHNNRSSCGISDPKNTTKSQGTKQPKEGEVAE